MARRKTIRDIGKLYQSGTPITMVTCYDYTFARLVEKADIDCILIGDSLGNVIQGHDTTLPVTVDDIIYHTQAVLRGNDSAYVIADMPFMSYQGDVAQGMHNAGRLLKEGGAQAVKIEGGEHCVPLVERLERAGIPVVGHLGLTPQSVHKIGLRVQARGEAAADRLVDEARALERAGIDMLVLEMVPAALAARVTAELGVPTIGIGAGNQTSGQVLVLQDLLGMNKDFHPKFLKRFAELEDTIVGALGDYRDEVRQRSYPDDAHSFSGE